MVCSTTGLGFQCPGNTTCGNNEAYEYLDDDEDDLALRPYIGYGITNFNNLGSALLSVNQIINSDTWYLQMEDMMNADIPIFGAAFCIILIVVGQFFLMNLILAVIIFSFLKT
jgi:hypothetical protein